jgi:ferredoxin
MVSVDQSLCSGCGLCVELCPEVFTVDSEGRAIAIKDSCEEHNLEEIVDQCPAEAINI